MTVVLYSVCVRYVKVLQLGQVSPVIYVYVAELWATESKDREIEWILHDICDLVICDGNCKTFIKIARLGYGYL